MKYVENIPFSGRLGPLTATGDGHVFSCYPEFPTVEQSLRPGLPQSILGRWSYDAGATWTEPSACGFCPPTPGVVIAALPLRSSTGRLHVFSLRFFKVFWEPEKRAEEAHSEIWHIRSDDRGNSWSAPDRIDFGHSYTGSLNSAIELKSGRILLPFSYLSSRQVGRFVSAVVYSDDRGSTWKQGANDLPVECGGDMLESGSVEPVAAELGDGRVWLVIRTQNGFLYESFSEDGGVSWGVPRPTRFHSSNAPAGLLRLRDGRLFIAWNYCTDGPVHWHNREVLYGAVSHDDGRTWRGFREIARKRESDEYQQITYPYLCEAPTGLVLLIAHERWNRLETVVRVLRVDPERLEQESL